MAIVLKNGNYIKIILNKCYIDCEGVHITYAEYKSTNDREFEKKNNSSFDKFIQNVSDYIEDVSRYLKDKVGDLSNISSEQELQNKLSVEDKDRLNRIRRLNEDINLILQYSYSLRTIDEDKLQELELLKKLGYNQEILSKTEVTYKTTRSSAHTNQRITYGDMYSELKKIYMEDGSKDC